MNTTPRLSLSYIVAGQAQKEVTHNDALNDLDSLAQISVISMTVATPPGSPAEGDSYIIGTSPTGAWSGFAGKIASYYSGWRIKTPREGWRAWVQNLDQTYVFDGSNWTNTQIFSSSGLKLNGATSGTITLNAAAIAGTNTLTLPAATDTLVGKATTDTLTNKTFDTGSTGNAFKLNGSTVSTVPQFQSALMLQTPPQGRLTLSSGNPIMNADATAQSTIYYAPHNGLYVPVYDGTQIGLKQFTSSSTDTAGLSLALDSSSGHTGYHQSGKIFDLFVANDSGTLRLVTGPAWSSGTARGTGAGTTELQRFMGITTNKNSMTARFGSSSGNTITVAANQGTYVGSFYATADGQTGMAFKPSSASGGANNYLALYNAYNRARVTAACVDSTSSYTGYTSITVRAANASNSNRITFLDGLQQSQIGARYFSTISSSGFNPVQIGVGLDNTTTMSGMNTTYQGSLKETVSTNDLFTPLLGLHYVQALESGQTGVTWYGDPLEGLFLTLEM